MGGFGRPFLLDHEHLLFSALREKEIFPPAMAADGGYAACTGTAYHAHQCQ